MSIFHIFTISLFFLATVTLLSFKIYNLKKYCIDIIIIFLIILAALESSLLNGPCVVMMIKQKSDEYIKEIILKYPVSAATQVPIQYRQFSTVIKKMSFFNPSDNNKAAILLNGDNTYSAIFNEMNNAKNHIHIEDFIMRDDEIGKKFQEILIKKASEGVKVRLLVDGLGFKFKRTSVSALKKSGIQIVIKSPVLKSIFQGDFNYRDHRKIYIIDGKTAFTGGINVGEEYIGKDPKIGYWRDTDIMLTGDSTRQLQSVFLSSWYAYTGQKILEPVYYPEVKTGTKQTVQISTGYPIKENPIEYTYLNLINSAQKSILIETPYLTLDDSLFHALYSASLKGINVTIIIPSKPDEKIVYSSTLQNADRLTELGIKVYKYPSFIHSKLVIIDGIVASLGTVNFNSRSMHLDLENTSILYGGDLLDSLSKTYQEDLSKSKPFILGESKSKGILGFFYNKLAQIISSTI